MKNGNSVLARQKYCAYLHQKRVENYNYIERVLCEPAQGREKSWMNSVRLTGEEIVALQEPGVIRTKSEQFFVLSLSLAKLVDSGNLTSLLKSVQQLLDEFDKYYCGDAKLGRAIRTTQTFVLQQCWKVQYNTTLQKEKQKQILHSLYFNGPVFVEDGDNTADLRSSTIMAIDESPESIERIAREPTMLLRTSVLDRTRKPAPPVTPFNMLSIVNVPFDLNFKEVILGLCEMIKGIYGNFHGDPNEGNIDGETLKQIRRIDKTINRHVLQPLCAMINDAAGKAIAKQLDGLFLL
ncbi:MAG: hypothetical protein P4M11_10820 [Candidatus Pacebacteria bacterium]|nr:hypothetical protein [Candidatus Paceibacterota bacterium]